MENELAYHVRMFLSIFANCGGVIHGSKKLKSILYHLSRKFPNLIPYEFDAWFFGPYSRQLGNDLDDLCWHSWLRCFLEEPKGEIEPIHHIYDLSHSSLSSVLSTLPKLEKFLYQQGVMDMKDLSSRLIALEILPPSIAMNIALLGTQKQNVDPPSTIEEPSIFIRADYAVRFTRENIGKLLDWYEKHGIKFVETFPPNKFKIEIEPEIVDDLVSKRYDYIKLDKTSLDKYRDEYAKVHEYIKDYPLFDFIEKKVGTEPILSKIFAYLEVFEKEYNLNNAREMLDKSLDRLKVLLKETSKKEKGLTICLSGSTMKLEAYPDYKKAVKWHDDDMINIYHFLQPLERLHLL